MNLNVKNQGFFPFIFDQIRLKEACWINDEPYFTRLAIGEWLEYKFPQEAIDRIIKRNPHINQFSTTVKLTTTDEYPNGHSQVKLTCECRKGSALNLRGESSTIRTREIEARVYNPIGFQLVVYESHQAKAKAFKIMVAHLVYAFTRGELKPPRNIEAQRLYLQCREALGLVPYRDRPIAVKYLAEKHGKSSKTIYRWMSRIERGENPAETRLGHHRGRIYMSEETENEIIDLVEKNPSITVRETVRRVARADCTAKYTISRIKRQVKEQLRRRVIKRLEGAVKQNI